MIIQEVTTPQITKEWLLLPYAIYANDPNWIAPIQQEIEQLFTPGKNKLYKNGNAKRWLLRDDQHRPIGRIAAFHHQKYAGAQTQPTGGIGFFECIEHSDAARMLLQTACDWLITEGMKAVDGPINFGEKEAYWGLLVENFKDMSSFRMNYNPPYYQKFFEQFGFQTYYEQLCYQRSMLIPVQEVFVRKNEILNRDSSYSVRNCRGRNLRQIAHDFVTVYNAAWAGLSGFHPMKPEQALKIVQAMKPVMDKDILIFAYHHQRPIGFYINLPEVNEFMRHVNGNLNLWGIIKFLYYRTFAKRQTMVGLVFGVDQEYQGKGVEAAMIKFCEEQVVTLNRYQQTILTWVGDFNPKMIHVVENLGATPYRKLITYRKMLDPGLTFQRHPILK